LKPDLRFFRRWPYALAALVMAAIVHILTTLALPHLHRADAYSRLSRTLPAHTFVRLPEARPRAQVLPFQLPDTRYAICRFDVGGGPVTVTAVLPEPGWSLTAYSSSGDAFYAFPASEQRRLNITLLLLPPGEQFLGPLGAAANHDPERSNIASPSLRGLVVLRAPMKGRISSPDTERDLAAATCRKSSF
jgi:uncharacterized membrane protein